MSEKYLCRLRFPLIWRLRTYLLLLSVLSVLILVACGFSPAEPTLTSAPLLYTATLSYPTVTDNSPATSTPQPEAQETQIMTPSPIPIGPQILANSGFDNGVGDWDRPYGSLSHTKTNFHTGPGAGRLTTSDFSGFMEYRGNIGQCIDLTDYLDQWPVINGDMHMVLEAYLRPGEDIYRVTLNGIFIDDTRCGTGHMSSFDIPALEGSDDWFLLSGDAVIPDTARSIHVFISANGATDTAEVLIDDVRAYAWDPGIH